MDVAQPLLLAVSAVAGVAVLALAVAVFAAGPQRPMNRRLALVLVADGVFLGSLVVLVYLHPPLVWDNLILYSSMAVVSVTYVVFTATLDTPFARALRRRAVLAPVVGLIVLSTLATQAKLVLDARSGFTDAELEATDLGLPWPTIALASVLALIVSIDAYRRAEHGTPVRRRAGFFALAFGTRDVFIALTVGLWALFEMVLGRPDLVAPLPFAIPIGILLYACLLAYGILQTQLFDIDLKIKSGISRSTVAAVGIAAVLIAAKVTEFYVSSTLGIVAGGVMAGFALFLAPRLNKLGDKVANTAMPHVQPTSSYLEFKKMEVYRAAIESALENDGRIDERERAMLDRMRGKLGIPEADAAAMESEVAGADAPAQPSAA